MTQRLTFDEHGTYLTTLNDDGSVTSEKISSEAAAQFAAERGY